jgi:hypothetical protein
MGFYSQHLADCPRALGPDDGDEARVNGRAGKAEEHGRVAVGRGYKIPCLRASGPGGWKLFFT